MAGLTPPETLLDVRDLNVSFNTDEGRLTAVDGISFSVPCGKTLGIVGGSGSGKSVATRALMQLLPTNARLGAESRIRLLTKAGSVVDVNALPRSGRAVQRIRGGEISMIFQEPMASFSPVWTIGNQLIEVLRLHRNANAAEARTIALDALEKVGISNPDLRLGQYSHELSGGMRQRAMIAMALATNPSLLIADEPTTALDVTIQAQVIALMNQLQRDLGMSIIFITHDMGVIAHVADEVAVMYLGKIVERGPTEKVIHDPRHPYTKGLLAALPHSDNLRARLVPIPGEIPAPMEKPAGCPFHPRCTSRIAGVCDRAVPEEVRMGDGVGVSCFLFQEPHA
jgi:peptide/nickel transport system ATP-binding protein